MFEFEKIGVQTYQQVVENQRIQRLPVLTHASRLLHGVWGDAQKDAVHLFYLCHMAMHIKSGDHVIDLKCGNGDFLLKAAAKYTEVQFVGVDSSHTLLEFARQRAAELKLDNVRFIHTNLLPGVATRFNLIVSIQNESHSLQQHLLASDGVVFEAYYSQIRKKIVFTTRERPRTRIWERKRIYHLPLRQIPVRAFFGFMRIQLFASVRTQHSY